MRKRKRYWTVRSAHHAIPSHISCFISPREQSMHPEFYPHYLFSIMPSKCHLFVVVLASLACISSVHAFAQRTVPVSFPKASLQQQSAFESTQLWGRLDDDDVQVNLIPDVDSVTLSAVGFGLIAFNFFVLANLGDGGIAGVLATIINSANQ
jgi:hypothetical protein